MAPSVPEGNGRALATGARREVQGATAVVVVEH